VTKRPAWADWGGGSGARSFTLGVEEEVMLLTPATWALTDAVEAVTSHLPAAVVPHAHPETQAGVVELATGVHETVAGAVADLRRLRRALDDALDAVGLAAAVSGTHPFANWTEVTVSRGERQQHIYGSMRELARREPTFALHVHVGVAEAEHAVTVANALRAHLPLLLALSANSPFWQGRDSGLASARTPLFQAFPRVGIPRAFDGYADYVEAVDLLLRVDAIPEPTYLWWDVRPQPRFGTVEVRIMDAQTTTAHAGALVALVQCLVALALEGPAVPSPPVEALNENRFLAARDGVAAELIDAAGERRVPVRELAGQTVAACAPHADALGCRAELESVWHLVEAPPAGDQLALARGPDGLPGLVSALADRFEEPERGGSDGPLKRPAPAPSPTTAT
jgi:carboxylate-amine ligase